MPVSVLHEGGHERILVGTAQASLRLDVALGTLLEGPVTLTYLVPGLSASVPKFNTAQRLLTAYRHARLTPGAALSTSARKREIHCLMAFDALRHGASLREIGELVFGAKAVGAEWSGPSEYMKSTVRRLVARARERASGGYKFMLHRP
jgi:hypothetical protein